jgi:hypothetical protein
MKRLLLASALIAATAPAQIIGGPLPPNTLSNFKATKATSLEAYSGRLVLLEFFMYW